MYFKSYLGRRAASCWALPHISSQHYHSRLQSTCITFQCFLKLQQLFIISTKLQTELQCLWLTPILWFNMKMASSPTLVQIQDYISGFWLSCDLADSMSKSGPTEDCCGNEQQAAQCCNSKSNTTHFDTVVSTMECIFQQNNVNCTMYVCLCKTQGLTACQCQTSEQQSFNTFLKCKLTFKNYIQILKLAWVIFNCTKEEIPWLQSHELLVKHGYCQKEQRP